MLCFVTYFTFRLFLYCPYSWSSARFYWGNYTTLTRINHEMRWDEMRWAMRLATLFNEGDIWQYFSYTDNLMALKPNPPCQLSLLEETGVPGENPRLSAERWQYSFHMRTGFESTLRWTLLGIELGTLEVKTSGLTTTPPKPQTIAWRA